MRRTPTTVIAVVGGDDGVFDRLSDAGNVRTVRPDLESPALDRAVAAWAQASRTPAPYTVHDADPLATVAEAWVGWFDGRAPAGELEVAVAETVARWRAGSLDLPDYYLLVDPEDWDRTRRHWYLGYLAATAPVRVVATAADVVERIGRLATGPWWPDLDRLLAGVERVVPDQAGLPGATLI